MYTFDKTEMTILAVLGLIIAMCAAIGGYEYAQKKVRKEAVKAGVATWGFDESGSVTVNWKK
jgi:hypothetical protein